MFSGPRAMAASFCFKIFQVTPQRLSVKSSMKVKTLEMLQVMTTDRGRGILIL
jgi:hypothetical protein